MNIQIEKQIKAIKNFIRDGFDAKVVETCQPANGNNNGFIQLEAQLQKKITATVVLTSGENRDAAKLGAYYVLVKEVLNTIDHPTYEIRVK